MSRDAAQLLRLAEPEAVEWLSRAYYSVRAAAGAGSTGAARAPAQHRQHFVRFYRMLLCNGLLEDALLFLDAQRGRSRFPFPNELTGTVAWDVYQTERKRRVSAGNAQYQQSDSLSVVDQHLGNFKCSAQQMQACLDAGMGAHFVYQHFQLSLDPLYVVADPQAYMTLLADPYCFGPRVHAAFLRVREDPSLRGQLLQLWQRVTPGRNIRGRDAGDQSSEARR